MEMSIGLIQQSHSRTRCENGSEDLQALVESCSASHYVPLYLQDIVFPSQAQLIPVLFQ